MSDNNEQIQSLKAQVETLQARLKDLDEEKVQAQISELEKSCADKDAEINELESKLEAAKQDTEASQQSANELETAKAESDKAIAELTEKLNAIEAENLRTSRVSALVDKGVDKTEAEALVETFAGITDEQFDALVSKLSEAPFHDKHKDDEKKKKKDEEEEDKAKGAGNMRKKYAEKADTSEAEELVEAEGEAEDAEALQSAESEDSVALAAHSEDESQAVVASLNQYFSEVLSGTSNKEES